MKQLLGFGCAVLILLGCAEDPCGPDEKSAFEVQVLATNLYGEPVEGAWIEGGADWDCFTVKTDSRGVAILPGRARGQRATIHRNDYFPRIVYLEPTKYWLLLTPKRLEYIGKVSETSVRFSSDMLLTLKRGKYQAYSYSDTSVTKLAEMPLLGTAIRATRFYGDTLWYSTHNSGIFAYSVEDPLNPVHLFSLDISGYLGAFAVKDGFITVGDPWGYEPVRVFSYTPGGEIHKVAEIDAFHVQQMELLSHHLVILSYEIYGPSAAGLKVADFSDPTDPDVVYALAEQGADCGLIHDNAVLIGPYRTDYVEVSYTTIDLSSPGHPIYVGRTYSDARLKDVSGGSYAVGNYYPQNALRYLPTEATAVLEWTPEGKWETVAILTDVWYARGSVHAPPYFVLGGNLWRLRDQ